MTQQRVPVQARVQKHNKPGMKKKRSFKRILGRIFIVLLALGLIGGVAFAALAWTWVQDLPDYTDSSLYNSAQKTQIYASDRTTLLAELYVENREPVPWDQVSQFVKEGSVATEDERFYQHGGFDPIGIARAALVTLTGKGREGASTITQQLVRNTALLDEMQDLTIKRKVREIFIATKLEEQYSKDEILLMYLNTINYGNGTYGIQAASEAYFSKPAKDLSLVEAATLVGIPQSPTANNPLEHPENCVNRRNVVLERMLKNGYINQEQYQTAVNTPLDSYLKPQKAKAGNGLYKYPYFTSYVRQVLTEKYDKDQIFKGGLKVYTTLDVATQDAAEAAAKRKEASIPKDFEVALTAVDPETGFIRAMVGGKDYNKDQYNLATQAHRQPGSTFKTFTLVSSIEDGLNPNTMIDCSSPVTIDDWRVENYNGASYGTRTIEGAFAISSNTAFARLATYLTPDRIIETAKRMGVESSMQSVPSLTLGTQTVTTKEMAQSFATIASGGVAREAVPIEEIQDHKGKSIFKADTRGVRALSPEVAYATAEVMKGVVTHGTGRAAALKNGQPVAGKTGTTSNFRDSYFCGLTPQYSVAIWLGARNERPMPTHISASTVFSDFLNQVLGNKPVVDFKKEAPPRYTQQSDAKLHIGTPVSETRFGKYADAPSNGSVDDIDAQDTPSDETEGRNPAVGGGGSSGGGTPAGAGGTSSGSRGFSSG